jgi:hypothetical protein
MSIKATSTNCPAGGRVAVIPVDSPTVANADTVSYNTASKENCVISTSTTAEITTAATENRATESA